MSAGERWSHMLAGWAIPQEILDGAPESPWGFPTGVFVQSAREALEHGREKGGGENRGRDQRTPGPVSDNE
jgi:hypothetical protein